NLSWKTVAGLKTGHFSDDLGTANDSNIPEFVDRFSDPLPFLYLRCKLSVDPILTGITATNNSVITYTPNFNSTSGVRVGPYDLSQIQGYTSANIGAGKTVKASEYKGPMPFVHGLTKVDPTRVLDKSGANYEYPYDAFPYFQNPSTPNTPRQKDS